MKPSRRPGPVLEAEVIGLAGRGDAVLQLPSGERAFAAGGVPGARVRARILGKKAGVLRASIVAVERQSPHRTAPFCDVHDRCGGCSWQHVALAEQRAQKQQLARRAIADAAITAKWIGKLPDRGWRRRMRGHLRQRGGVLQAGFLAAASDELVPVGACPVLAPPLQPLLTRCAAWLGGRAQQAEVAAVLGREGVIARVDVRPARGAEPPELNEAVLAELGVRGVVLRFGALELRHGDDEVGLPEVERDDVRCSAAGFCQAGSAANAAIRAAVADGLRRVGPVEAAAEFYSGSGNLTGLMLDVATDVVTVEHDPEAAMRAERAFGGRGRCRVIEGAAEEIAPSLLDRPLWLLDPGRPGARGLVEAIGERGPQHVLYVSCAFDTLGRDTRMLRDRGYTVTTAALIDTFVHTPHFELVVLFSRGRDS